MGNMADPASGTEIRVECYAGHRGEERPRRFYLRSRPIDVVEILDRWLAPDHRYFKLRGDDGSTYIIRQDITTQRWELPPDDKAERCGSVPDR
jgi:hypothetical protein